MSKIYDIGYCRCCGQQIILNEEYETEDEANWEATGKCNCPQGRDTYFTYRHREDQIKNTHENINNLFVDTSDSILAPVNPEKSEAAVEILRNAVIPIVDSLLYKVSVDIPGGVKATISRSGKDDIIVSRADAVKRKLES